MVGLEVFYLPVDTAFKFVMGHLQSQLALTYGLYHPHLSHLTYLLPHLTSPHLTSPHLTSPHLSPHLTSPRLPSTSPLTSPHLASPHLTSLSPHLTSSRRIGKKKEFDEETEKFYDEFILKSTP